MRSIVEMSHIPDVADEDMAWTVSVLGQLTQPVWPPHEPLLTMVIRLENIVQSFHRHANLWTELDIRMQDVEYAWNDISAWPLDVWSPFWTSTEQIYIGSLKCACSLDKIESIYGRQLWCPCFSCQKCVSGARRMIGIGILWNMRRSSTDTHWMMWLPKLRRSGHNRPRCVYRLG